MTQICGTCLYCLEAKSSERHRLSERDGERYTHICAANQILTRPELFRCGGDDYLGVPAKQVETEDKDV
jgi:hypothetical protein